MYPAGLAFSVFSPSASVCIRFPLCRTRRGIAAVCTAEEACVFIHISLLAEAVFFSTVSVHDSKGLAVHDGFPDILKVVNICRIVLPPFFSLSYLK